MSGTTVTASTSVVLVPTSSNYTRPFIVTFPNISTFGRLVTVRDNDGFASTGNTIVLSTTSATAFNGVSGPLTINQPYGFITLASQANGTYSVLNTFAFPAGQAAANVSNLNAQVVNIQSTLNMYDFGTGSTNTIYTSSSQFIFNGNYIGQVTDEQLASTVTNLGTTGYLSSIPVVFVVPPTWIAVGQSSTISQASTTGSLVYSSNGANWFNATAGKGFAKYGTATTFGEAYYIAVGNNDTGSPNFGYNQWSFNSRDWYYSYGPALTDTQMRTACFYANGLFHSVGCNNGVGGPSTILWSDDGKSWTPSLGNPFAATNGTGYATGITFGSGAGSIGVWVCSGVQNTSNSLYSLLWSTDGSNWNPAASVSFGGSGGVMDVGFDGIRFVALCKGGNLFDGYNVCISTDGSNWFSSNIIGGNFNDQPRYIAGCNGTWVATTGNNNQSLVYSVDGGFTWQSNATLSGSNLPMYKPYYDGLKWWVGVETNDGSQSIYYTTESAPALSNWVNNGFIGGFSNGGFARGFTSTDGQSNVNAILNSTIFGLSVSFGTSNFIASTISVGTAYVGELNASTLFIGVTFVSTTYETINNISTQNVDFISAGTLVSSRNFLDSLSVNRVSVGQTVGGPAQLISLSTNTISSGTAYIGQLGVNVSSAQYSLDVGGSAWVRSTLYVGYDLSTNQIRFYGTKGEGPTEPTLGPFTHTVLAEYLYDDPQSSEFIIFKGNNSSRTLGPDRVRVLTSGGFQVDTGLTANWPEGEAPPIAYVPYALYVAGETGYVGINTSTPSQTLDVNGSLVSRVTTVLGESATLFNDDDSQRYMEHRGPRGAYIDFCAGATDFDLRIGYFSTSFAEIRTKNDSSASTIALLPKNGTGRVGINTTTPTHTLQTIGDICVANGTDTLLEGGAIHFGIAAQPNYSPMSLIKGALTQATGSECQGAISFQTRPEGTAGQVMTERMRISNNGNVFIQQNLIVGSGVTTPAATLDVNGSVWARSTLYVGSNSVTNQIRFYGTNDDGQGNFNRTVIGEYLYGGTEQSELILFKGDDATTAAGPDRVRVLAAGGFRVDTGAGVGTWAEGGTPPTAPYQNALFVSGENGRVGINSNLPSETLDVNGVLNLRAGTAQSTPNVDPANKTNTYAVFADAGSANDFAMLRQIGGSDNYHMALDLHDDDSVNFSIRKVRSSAIPDTIQTMFTIDGANSRVGIMTDSPQYTLDVNGSMRVQNPSFFWSDVNMYQTNLGTESAANGIIRMTTFNGNSYIQSGSNSTNTNNKLYFTNYNNSASKFTMDMVNTRMGINTDSPQYTLDVNGDMRVSGNMSNNGNLSNTGRIYIFNDGTAALPAIVFGSDTDSGIYHPADGQIAISINNSQRLLVTGSYTSNTGAFSNSGNITANGIFYGNGSGLSNIAFSFSVAAI
jgi:hypothetical protein